MSLFEKIIRLLKTSGVWYELLEHEPVFTSGQASAVRKDISLGQGAKAMVLKVKGSGFLVPSPEGSASQNSPPIPTLRSGSRLYVGTTQNSFVMVVCPGDLKIDFKKVRKFLSSADATLASPEEVESLVGVKIGAVCPFGNLSGLPTLVERRLLANEVIAFNVGDHRKSVKMKSGDYLRLSLATVGDFSKLS